MPTICCNNTNKCIINIFSEYNQFLIYILNKLFPSNCICVNDIIKCMTNVFSVLLDIKIHKENLIIQDIDEYCSLIYYIFVSINNLIHNCFLKFKYHKIINLYKLHWCKFLKCLYDCFNKYSDNCKLTCNNQFQRLINISGLNKYTCCQLSFLFDSLSGGILLCDNSSDPVPVNSSIIVISYLCCEDIINHIPSRGGNHHITIPECEISIYNHILHILR